MRNPWRHAAVAALFGTLLLSACGAAPPPPPPPTVVDVTLSGDPGLNPSPDGRPSPAVVRLYRLTSPAQFELADFFQLSDDAPGVLKAELVGVQEVVVGPGETQSVQIPMEDTAHYLGVTVGYRALDQATWRGIAEIPPHATTPVKADLGPLAVSVQVAAPPPAEPGS